MESTASISSNCRDTVICLHSSMSSSKQWQQLEARLQPFFDVNCIDLHGYGNAPEWAAGITGSLDREVELVGEFVNDVKGPVHLVGHSYGGVVAIKAAQVFGARISSLTLYEPVVFAALLDGSEDPQAGLEVIRLISQIHASYRSGNLLQAAQQFIDYWSGKGTWDAIPMQKQFQLAAQVPSIIVNFEAIMSESNSLQKLAKMTLPILCLSGKESPAAAQAITDLLKLELPQAVRHRFNGMGHMGPITHAELVNARIERFIKHRAAQQHKHDYAWAA